MSKDRHCRNKMHWFKLYFNCYKYEDMKTENSEYPGSDKKPKACPEVISCNAQAQLDAKQHDPGHYAKIIAGHCTNSKLSVLIPIDKQLRVSPLLFIPNSKTVRNF